MTHTRAYPGSWTPTPRRVVDILHSVRREPLHDSPVFKRLDGCQVIIAKQPELLVATVASVHLHLVVRKLLYEQTNDRCRVAALNRHRRTPMKRPLNCAINPETGRCAKFGTVRNRFQRVKSPDLSKIRIPSSPIAESLEERERGRPHGIVRANTG